MLGELRFKKANLFFRRTKKSTHFNTGFTYNIYLDCMFALTDMKMTATCLLLPEAFGEDSSLFVVVNDKVCSMSMTIGLIFNTIN